MLDEVIIARMEAMIRIIFTRIDIQDTSPAIIYSSALQVNKSGIVKIMLSLTLI
jgi:hypothetical protein